LGTLAVTNCTLAENTTYGIGGGIFNQGIPTVTNSTFTANSSGRGDAIANSIGTLEVTNSTFTGNSATVRVCKTSVVTASAAPLTTRAPQARSPQRSRTRSQRRADPEPCARTGEPGHQCG
jgi:hypothetical protein